MLNTQHRALLLIVEWRSDWGGLGFICQKILDPGQVVWDIPKFLELVTRLPDIAIEGRVRLRQIM